MPHRLHPSLIIGLGNYGRDALTRLLWSAAARGVLPRIDARASEGALGRRIEDLELIVTPVGGSAGPAGPVELLTDLRRLVVEVEGGQQQAENLGSAISLAADRLLRAQSSQPTTTRLDVYVLLHVDAPATLGEAMSLLSEPLARLASRGALKPIAQGAPLLSVVLLLDTDEFWGSAPAAAAIRRGVRNVLTRGEEARRAGRPGFSKIHLLDGDATTGRRDRRERIDEAAILLEFLLYEGFSGDGQSEGVRSHPTLRTLVQRSMNDEAPLVSVGIRTIERSSGRLSRLAAAAFGNAWMVWLQGRDEPGDRAGVEADRRLAGLEMDEAGIVGEPGALDAIVDRHLKSFLDAGGRRIEEVDWAAHVRSAAVAAEAGLEQDLQSWADARHNAAGQVQVGALQASVREAVDDLLTGDTPIRLGGAIARIEALRHRLGRVSPPSELAGALTLSGIDSTAADWSRFRASQIDPMADRPWWLGYAAVLAAGTVPVLTSLIRPGQGSLDLFGGLVWPIGLVMLACTVALVVHSRIYRPLELRVRRAREFYTHPERGRLRGALHALTAPGGAISDRFNQRAERARTDLLGAVRAMAAREIDAVLHRARERHREVGWLAAQLADFLRRNDVDPRTYTLSQRTSPHRHAFEAPDEVLRFLAQRRPEADAFVLALRHDRPLANWAQPFNEVLLDPLRFIEEQSKQFPDPTDPLRPEAATLAVDRTRALIAYIQSLGQMTAPFRWPGEAGVQHQRFAVLPAAWESEHVAYALQSAGIPVERQLRSTSQDRCHILTITSNVPLEALE